MTPYAPEEYRAQHLDGCTLDADHAGACRLARPFHIRPEGGREYVGQDERPKAKERQAEGGRAAMESRWRDKPGPDGPNLSTPTRTNDVVADALGTSTKTRQDAEQFVREALGEWAAEYDVPALADALHEHAGRSWDMSRVPEETFWQVVKQHERPAGEVLATDHELRAQMRAERDAEGQDVPMLDSTDAAAAEVRWVAGEARALMAEDDPQRRARFVARKRALLAYIEQTMGAGR